MVAGDLVNTASRDPVASPSPAPCSSATRRDARPRRRSPTRTPAARAEGQGRACCRSGGRCASSPARAAALKSAGLEAPFVGRDRELRLVKELFHATADERQRAQLVSVDRHRRDRQVAARLGVRQVHRRAGRRSSGGIAAAASPTARASPTGRSRRWCGCARGSPRTRAADSALAKLRACRRAARPRSRRSGASSSRGWRTCSASRRRTPRARGAVRGAGGSSSSGWPSSRPGGAGLRGHAVGGRRRCSTSSSTCSSGRATTRSSSSRSPARSCPSAGRPGARAGATSPRSTSSRCPAEAMESCWTASCRACPRSCATQILERAEGIPLYAVETVRMLLDRGVLVAGRGRVTGPTGPIEALEVPETLHALIAARLDGLDAARSGGCSRTQPCSARRSRAQALARCPGLREDELEPLLRALVRKEILAVQADPRSPEHGQYGFLQDLSSTSPTRRCRSRNGGRRHLAAAALSRASLCRRGRGRRGRRVPLPGRVPCGAGRRGRGRDQGQGARDARAGGRASRLAAAATRGAALLRAGGRAGGGSGGARRARGTRRSHGVAP